MIASTAKENRNPQLVLNNKRKRCPLSFPEENDSLASSDKRIPFPDQSPLSLASSPRSSPLLWKEISSGSTSSYITQPGDLLSSLRCGLESDDAEMIQWMGEREELYQPDYDAIRAHPFVKSYMRSRLIDWLQELCQSFMLSRETFHISINYLDRYLASRHHLRKGRLQLVGVTCVFVAAKLEETKAPRAAQLCRITNNAVKEDCLLECEIDLLSTLGWVNLPTTPFMWVKTFIARAVDTIDALLEIVDDREDKSDLLQLICSVLRCDSFVKVMELIDACILDEQSIQYLPSTIAATALQIVHPMLEEFRIIPEFSENQVDECTIWMRQFEAHPRVDTESSKVIDLKNPSNYSLQIHHPHTLCFVEKLYLRT